MLYPTSGRSRIFCGGGTDPLGGVNPQHVHFLVKTYAKMKEIDPVGGHVPAAPPPGSANLESPKTLRQTRAFCGMVNFLSSHLPNLCRLLILIYDLQKKATKFKWTEEAEKAFNEIKKLLINPPVLKAPTTDGLFQLESDTSREGVGGTLLQKQGDEWEVIGYHSKRLPKSAKNFGITELELTGLLVNIHGFIQLLCNRYFKS